MSGSGMSPYTRVQLLTRTREFVAEVNVLPLQPPAEVIVWGTRVFVRNLTGEYREGFAVVAQSVVVPFRKRNATSEDAS